MRVFVYLIILAYEKQTDLFSKIMTKHKWLQHAGKIEQNRFLKCLSGYNLRGPRDQGRIYKKERTVLN